MKNIVVFVVPTGIQAEIGGHAGDATPALRLIASTVDKVITHPNVVNASDINEMTYNTLYVEGSMLDRFLEGEFGFKIVNNNRILIAVNSPVQPETINAVSAARVTLGIDAKIVQLRTKLEMISKIENGIATGIVNGWEELVEQVKEYDFDALGIATEVTVSQDVALNYFKNGGVNPWGGVEAILSKLVGEAINKPIAHSPVEWADYDNEGKDLFLFNEVVDPRMAPEMISQCYLHCILKGLHKAPQIGNDILRDDILCMISPATCRGRSHEACLKYGIPIIGVKENKTTGTINNDYIIVENYLEAAGYVLSMREGICVESLRRPIMPTEILI